MVPGHPPQPPTVLPPLSTIQYIHFSGYALLCDVSSSPPNHQYLEKGRHPLHGPAGGHLHPSQRSHGHQQQGSTRPGCTSRPFAEGMFTLVLNKQENYRNILNILAGWPTGVRGIEWPRLSRERYTSSWSSRSRRPGPRDTTRS